MSSSTTRKGKTELCLCVYSGGGGYCWTITFLNETRQRNLLDFYEEPMVVPISSVNTNIGSPMVVDTRYTTKSIPDVPV